MSLDLFFLQSILNHIGDGEGGFHRIFLTLFCGVCQDSTSAEVLMNPLSHNRPHIFLNTHITPYMLAFRHYSSVRVNHQISHYHAYPVKDSV